MLKWRRDTHENGKLKRDIDTLHHKRAWNFSETETGFIGHFLYPNKWLTFDEIIDKVRKYESQFPEDFDRETSVESIALALILLVDYNFAVVEDTD